MSTAVVFEYSFGDQVVLDKDATLPVMVVGMSVDKRLNNQYLVSWWCQGDVKEKWVDEWRLAWPT